MGRTNINQTYAEEIEQWRAQLDEGIRAENSWLALAGLFWLNEGANFLGRSPQGDIIVSSTKMPDQLGMLNLKADQVTFEPNKDLDLEVNDTPASKKRLNTDTEEHPDFITLGQLRFVVIRRGKRIGLRFWDNQRPEREHYPRRSWYPIKPEFRLNAEFLATPKDYCIEIPDALGGVSSETVTGELVFNLDDSAQRLLALEAGEGSALIIFSDQTNGETTYPGGRFLIVNHEGRSEEIIDFNRAFNPPCAFSPYATCPLPPAENVLATRIEAGERYQPA